MGEEAALIADLCNDAHCSLQNAEQLVKRGDAPEHLASITEEIDDAYGALESARERASYLALRLGVRSNHVPSAEGLDTEEVRGKRVFWHDPETRPESDCSGLGRVVDHFDNEGELLNYDTIVRVNKDDGGEVEAFAGELTVLP